MLATVGCLSIKFTVYCKIVFIKKSAMPHIAALVERVQILYDSIVTLTELIKWFALLP